MRSEKTLGSQEGPVMLWKTCKELWWLGPRAQQHWLLAAPGKRPVPRGGAQEPHVLHLRAGHLALALPPPRRASLKPLLCPNCLSTGDHMTSFLEPASSSLVDLILSL